jgi:MerR family transcriptional regulator, copper efflux regulator
MENSITYSINEAADLLNLSAKTIRRYIKSGKLPSVKVSTKFGEEYRITELPENLKAEAEQARADKVDVVQVQETRPSENRNNGLDIEKLYQENMRLAAQLGATSAQLAAANERIHQLENQVKLLEAPKPQLPWWKRLFGINH